MSGQLKSHRSITAQVVLYIFLTLGPTLTGSDNGVHEKKIYGNWQVRQNQRYCRQVLYCEFREANCAQVTTANTWTCNRINAEIAEKGCVMRICKTDLKMVCSATSPGAEYQETSSDSCPLGEKCFVNVTPQTNTLVPLNTSPASLKPGASTPSPAALMPSPASGPTVTTVSSTQNGAAPLAETVPGLSTSLGPGATTASVPGSTPASIPEATTAPVPGETTALVPGETTAPVPVETTAPVPRETTAPVPRETTAPVPRDTTAPVTGETTAPVVMEIPAPRPG
ncbi:unnamed protein product [Lymnaea stagnalis]|uniref:Uncharacterized protein n=1 Tax=Lymnaea stagnalis TaxID=6523 RepID=A0AAV2I4E0_LYMST